MDVSIGVFETSEKLLHQWGQPQQTPHFAFASHPHASEQHQYKFITSHLLRQLQSNYTNPEIPPVA